MCEDQGPFVVYVDEVHYGVHDYYFWARGLGWTRDVDRATLYASITDAESAREQLQTNENADFTEPRTVNVIARVGIMNWP